MAFNTTNAFTLGQDLLNSLNKWDLQHAAYNGITFYMPKDSFSVVQQLQDLQSTFYTLLGANTGRLPAYTTSLMTQVQDTVQKKLATSQLLNSNKNLIDDQGAGPERFVSVGLIQGDNYLLAWQNIYSKFLATQGDSIWETISPAARRVFNHPVRGKIENVYCNTVNILHTAARYKAIFFIFDFVAETITNPPGQSASAQVFSDMQTVINAVVSTINVVNNTTEEAQLFIQSITATPATNKANILNTQPTMNTILSSTVPTAQAAAQIIYQQFSPGIPSVYLESVDVDYSTVGLNNFNNSSPQSVQSILDVLANNINTQVAAMVSLGTDGLFNDVIVALQQCMGTIYNFSRFAIYQQESTFVIVTTPQATNLFSLLYENGYDPNSEGLWTQIYKLNYNFPYSMNNIPANASIKLPVNKDV